MGIADELIENNRAYAAKYTPDRPLPPRRQLAIVSCMDSRIDVFDLLGLDVGDAHVMRNAGGVVTDDVIRSLIVSVELLGTMPV